jgi:hypothetical protein
LQRAYFPEHARTVADDWLPKVIEWNRTLDPAQRFDAAMKAQGLFEVTPAPAP